jgi:oxygen-independent coproporphyrinogen-3 oxidase
VIRPPLGVYVHFPYCTRRCPYCDFAVHARRRIPHEAYAEAAIRELLARAPWFGELAATSLYFGGGTPGLWRPEALGTVVAAVRARLRLTDDAEVTVEVNPGEIDEPQLAALRRAGVTRLSIGAQSFDDRSLRVLGRTHDARAARGSVALARRAGFTDVSVDVMFALPRSAEAAHERELDAVLALEADHVSAYGLTVEPRTAFAALARAGAIELPSSDEQAALYERTDERLRAAGYLHHEISSWARPGHAARHNTLYWRGGEYLGLGCSAASLRVLEQAGRPSGERFTNLRSVDRWLAAGRAAPVAPAGPEADPRVGSVERLDPDAFEREALWLGLRLVAGIERAHHRSRFGRDPRAASAAFAALEAAGLVEEGPTHLRLTARGRLLADEVGARILGA